MTTKIEDRIYIDLDALKEAEIKDAIELENLLNERIAIKEVIDSAEIARKVADKKLLEYLEGLSADGLVSGDNVVDVIEVQGRVSWDRDYLVRTLKPNQLARAMKKGKGYKYPKVDTTGKKAEKVREILEG